ncbi:MAG: hypothetical protein C5B50_17250 [Verrucomicrobia bacterium]|nr:MAG: hypothetical protein C5B50_17250 [Verrucomicrobiota bacterium]
MKQKKKLRIKDAVRLEGAEMRLQKGKPQQALRKLQRMTERAWDHPWTEHLVWRAAQAMG